MIFSMYGMVLAWLQCSGGSEYNLEADHDQRIKAGSITVRIEAKHKLRFTRSRVGNSELYREHPATCWKLVDLASRAQLSPRYYAIKFKGLMGVTVQDYQIQRRLERAEFLLRYGGMSVTENSSALGYQDVYYFSKQFKKRYGKNPSEIR